MHSLLSWHWIFGNHLQPKELYSILSLRQEVFVVEQNCPYLDTDGRDFECFHVLGFSENKKLIAYARVFAPVQEDDDTHRVYIGRVIIKKSHRGLQLGQALMEQSERFAIEEFDPSSINELTFALHAQAHLQRFYGSLGYSPKGDLFDEDGIPHILMLK